MDLLRTAAGGRAIGPLCAPVDGRVLDSLRAAAVRRASIDGRA